MAQVFVKTLRHEDWWSERDVTGGDCYEGEWECLPLHCVLETGKATDTALAMKFRTNTSGPISSNCRSSYFSFTHTLPPNTFPRQRKDKVTDPNRTYTTTPNIDPDLHNFQGRIEQYAVLCSAEDLDTFMRHCVSTRALHDFAVPSSSQAAQQREGQAGDEEGSDEEDFDVLRISEYEILGNDPDDTFVVHPIDEIAMDDSTVCSGRDDSEGKAILITNFLGPRAEWPLLFFWRPAVKRLGLFLPSVLIDGDQETVPRIRWEEALQDLKRSRRVAGLVEKVWDPAVGRVDEELEEVFMMLVRFFNGRMAHPENAGHGRGE